MKQSTVTLVLATLGALGAACQQPASKNSAAAAVSGSTSSSTASAETPAAAGPETALGKLDHRTPVPLLPMMAWHQKQNMMGHLEAIQGVVAAVAQEDWDSVAKASKGIESSPAMARSCEHMGAGAPGFTELALAFHDKADQIGKAAAQHNRQGVLDATAETLSACTGCHSSYRQRVVDERTWASLTGMEPQQMAGSH